MVWDESRYREIYETWGKRCDLIRFFVDASMNYTRLEEYPDVVALPTQRPVMCGEKPCRHIWEKVWRMWVWVEEHIADRADWFLKIDTDTFLFPENLRRYVKGLSPDRDLYTGHLLYHRLKDQQTLFAAGSCVLFSRKTTVKMGRFYRTMPKTGWKRCGDRDGPAEDLQTGHCAREAGVEISAARDENDRERFMPLRMDNALRTEKRDWWYWEDKPKLLGDLQDCCSDQPISFHEYKKPGSLYTMEQLFYGNEDLANFAGRYNSYDEKVIGKYVTRVRAVL